MSLMKLAPETVRLRRLAKAHAAGEVSEAAYRAARRALIDGFPAGPVDDDDTRPRYPGETTLRHGPIAAAHSNDEIRPTADSSPAASSALAAPSRRWLLLAALGLMLVAALLALPDAMAATVDRLDVPPVAKRDPDPANSPRLEVQDVRVAWGAGPAGEALAPGVLEALQQRAEDTLELLRARNAPGPHGFTAGELDEVARFLDVLGVHRGNGSLTAADARDLSALIREQKKRRGVSVAQLEQVAAAVQQEARARGYFLAVAYLPAQHVADGVARIDVLPGRLGDVVVEGGESAPARRAFATLMGRPLTLVQVSSRLQALNALPGITAQASFGPGDQVGESRLHLDLREQRGWTASVTADNHGDHVLGDQRLGATLAWLNPRGAGDRLSAGALVTMNPSNQRYGYLDYDTPVAGGYRLSARLGNNDFSQDGVPSADGVPSTDGSGVYLDVAARRSLAHTRRQGLTLVLTASRQQLDWNGGTNQTVTMAGLGIAGHRVLDAPRIAADAALSLTAGRIDGDRFLGQDPDFWLMEIGSEAWMPLHVPRLNGEQKLRLRLAGQWSDSLLPADPALRIGRPRTGARLRSQSVSGRPRCAGGPGGPNPAAEGRARVVLRDRLRRDALRRKFRLGRGQRRRGGLGSPLRCAGQPPELGAAAHYPGVRRGQ